MKGPARCETLIRALLGLSLLASGATCAQVVEENTRDISRDAAASTERVLLDPGAVAKRIVELTQEFRQNQGLQSVEPNVTLMQTAREFDAFVARTDKYSHEADGSRPSERARAHGYDYCIVAENIGYQYRSTGFDADELAQAFFDNWKRSPKHRQNMLDPDVTEIGVAVARSIRSGRWFAVQMLGLPRSAQRVVTIVNNAAATVSYELSDNTFSLPPRMTRTHQRCRPVRMVVHWPDGQPDVTIEPNGDEHYTVVRDESGRWHLDAQ